MSTKSIKQKVREHFLLNPTAKLRVRHIAQKLSIPLHSAIRYSQELKKEALLKETAIAGVKLYSADRSSEKFLLEKKLYNLRSLHESGLVEYLALEMGNPAIIVFGSYARGEDTEESDIDIYIQAQEKLPAGLAKFEKVLQRKIQLFSFKGIRGVKNKELANTILNGMTLNGFVEVF